MALNQEGVQIDSSQAPISPVVELLPSLLLSAALDDPTAGIVIFDLQRRVLHVTSQTARILELQSREPLKDLSILQLLSQSQLNEESVATAIRLIGQYPQTPQASVVLHSKDQTREVCMRTRCIGTEHWVVTFDLVSRTEGTKLKVSEFALRDSLTGLGSRHYFEETLTQVLARRPEEPITLFMIDLDRFKAVNDTLGHAVGDSLLRLAAERLKTAVRKEDLVARLGGDEFAVMMHPAVSKEEAIAIANRVLDLVQRTYLIEGQLVNVGVSIGIAQSPDDGNHCASLLRSADLALYHSKTSGRATFNFFADHMERRAQARRTSELELRRALALRQLEVFYQAQVSTPTNHLVGFEALLRWRHPERGLIPPGDFLPIAEEIGLIVPIGDWVLRTACREAMNWPSNIVIAVNASPLQFDAGNFADSVRKALSSSGLPGERLEIEITEGILLRNDDAVLNTLHSLRAMNVRIAMDDFGTGYASLSQLAKFPFDKIKIDRSLAGFDGDNLKQRAIVRAITALGKSLGVATLAEGVEDVDQLHRLQNDGCTSVQGYYFSRPIPSSQLEDVLARFS